MDWDVKAIADQLQINKSTVANICAKYAPRRFVPSRGASPGFFPPKPDSERKDRACLMCRSTFRSDGPGHRRCDPCQDSLNECSSLADEFGLSGIRLR